MVIKYMTVLYGQVIWNENNESSYIHENDGDINSYIHSTIRDIMKVDIEEVLDAFEIPDEILNHLYKTEGFENISDYLNELNHG